MAGQRLNILEETQRWSGYGLDTAVRSFAEVNEAFKNFTAEMTNFSNKAFEDGFRALQQMINAKSFDRALEVQTQYAKKAYDDYVAQVSKLGNMYVNMAQNAYKQGEQTHAKKAA